VKRYRKNASKKEDGFWIRQVRSEATKKTLPNSEWLMAAKIVGDRRCDVTTSGSLRTLGIRLRKFSVFGKAIRLVS